MGPMNMETPYMHKPQSGLEYESYKNLWDLQIQLDHLIQPRRLDFTLINKKRNCHRADFAVPIDQRSKNKAKWQTNT